MKLFAIIALFASVSVANAEMGESAYRDENRRVSTGEFGGGPIMGPPRSGEEITNDRYCADRPERCDYEARGRKKKRRSGGGGAIGGGHLVPSPGHCSNAGDQVARPVYREVNGQIVLAGWECVQDNRGGGN